jgi:hypothetical protein
MSKGWDLTSPRSLDAGAEWLRKEAGALLVLVIRAEDVAFAVDPAIAPADASVMVEVAMPEVESKLLAIRQAARQAVEAKQLKQKQKADAEYARTGRL